MATQTTFRARTTYPIFAATFAHNDPACLVVGGGGGPGRSGVGNKITIFDTSSGAADPEPKAEIELSRDEDSVTCLANLATKDHLILYAGINSCEADRLEDSNQHFRTFRVSRPRRKKTSKTQGLEKKPRSEISRVGKSTLFGALTSAQAKKDGYQRLLRLSQSWQSAPGSKRVGAIASSLAGKENEIVVFDATYTSYQRPFDVIHRIALANGEEALDMDILEPYDAQFQVAYATDHEVFALNFEYDSGKYRSHGQAATPQKKYSVPYPDVFDNKGRPKLRCLRWLSPDRLLVLLNSPKRSGAELRILHLLDNGLGSVVAQRRLPRHVKAAVDMDVCCLDTDERGAYQAVVAVAGVDISISMYTIDFHGSQKNRPGQLRPLTSFRDAHPVQMTKVVFSPYSSSRSSWSDPQQNKASPPGPQHLRLASTSLGNTIVVHTFALQLITGKAGSRHVVSSKSSQTLHSAINAALVLTNPFNIIKILIVIVIALFLYSPLKLADDPKLAWLPLQPLQQVRALWDR